MRLAVQTGGSLVLPLLIQLVSFYHTSSLFLLIHHSIAFLHKKTHHNHCSSVVLHHSFPRTSNDYVANCVPRSALLLFHFTLAVRRDL